MKPFKWLRRSPHLTLLSKLSPDEFAQRFVQCIDRPHYVFLSGLTGSTPILGTLTGSNFKLQDRSPYRSARNLAFYGRIQRAGSGSLITGYFSIGLNIKIFMIIWLSFATVMGSLFSYSFASSILGSDTNAIPGTLTGLGIMALLLLAIIFMRVIGKKKEERYAQFLSEAFDASLTERRD